MYKKVLNLVHFKIYMYIYLLEGFVSDHSEGHIMRLQNQKFYIYIYILIQLQHQNYI